MIGQNSNNRNVGTTTKDCDAGLPIAGRTGGTNIDTYQILKLQSDGTLTGFPLAQNGINYSGYSFAGIPLIAGPPPINTFIGKTISFFVGADGQYLINPQFIYPGGTGGGISFTLCKETTILANYIDVLPPFNTFAPIINDVGTGLYGYWHNTASQNYGSNLHISYNRNNTLSCYLTVGMYYFALTTDGAVNFNAGFGYFGINEFVKIG